MDKGKNKMSMLANLKSAISGYSIEIGDTTYSDSLEERIQAAKAACSVTKQAQKTKGKLSVPNKNIIVENNTQNMTIKKPNNSVQVPEFKKRNRQRWPSLNTDLVSVSNNPSITSININSNSEINYNLTSFKSTSKGGGLMQRRLEAIKANKKFLNLTPIENNVTNTLESIKFSNNPSKIDSHQALTKNYNCKQLDTNYSNVNENKARSIVQKCSSSKIDQRQSTLAGYSKSLTCTSSNSNYSATSVQNRLLKVKEEMKAKSKLLKQNYTSNTKMAEKLPVSEDTKLQSTHTPKIHLRNKTKRLSTSIESCKIKIPISTINKIKWNKQNLNKIIKNKELVTVQPVTPNHILSNPSETIVSTKLENQNVLKKSQQMELDSFSFVTPKTFSVQHRLENKKKYDNDLNTQLNNDDSMEWEEFESNNIVDTVNDLRKITHEYEPMEWMQDSFIPDTVLYCDGINYCFVVDTNILLLDLKSLSIALDKFFPEYGYLTFVLPWQVFQELDYIKKNDNQLGFRAREATRWMLDKFSKKHPRLKGQPLTNKEGESNDDAILKCAIYIKDRVNHISLITDDQILSIKSEVNGIPVKNSTWLKNLVSVNCGEMTEFNIFQEAVKRYPVIDNKLILKFEPHLEHIIARVLKFAVNQDLSYSSFSKKVWWKIYSLTPPLNLIKCLLKLKEHWNIIAPRQLVKEPQKHLEWLLCFFMDLQSTTPEINLSWNELYDFLNSCSETINALPIEYFHITDALLNDLMRARKCLKQHLNGTILNESLEITQLGNLKISNDNNLDVDKILYNISKEVEAFCSCVYKINGFHRDSTEKMPYSLYPKTNDFSETIENYCCKLSNLIKIMLKIKKFKAEQILESSIIIKDFLKSIVDFDYDKYYNLKTDNVIHYCLMKDKNSFLNTLVFLQNNLAAVKNLVTIVKF